MAKTEEPETVHESAQPEEWTPEPAEMVVRDDADLYRRMALEDERQVMEELQGRSLEVMLYSFEIDGRRQTGLAWNGVREAVRTLNARGWTQIRMSTEIPPKFEEITDEEGDDAVRCVVYAEDAKHGGGNYGIAIQKKKMRKRNGDLKPDVFAQHKALSKAQRNAFEPLIPLEAVEYLKAQYLGRPQNVRVIPGAASAVEVEQPAALTDDRAKTQVARLRELYTEIRNISPMAMLPGQFAAVVRGAQHDHDRLDDEIERLESFLATEGEIAAASEAWRQTVSREDFEREANRLMGQSQARRLGRFRELLADGEESS